MLQWPSPSCCFICYVMVQIFSLCTLQYEFTKTRFNAAGVAPRVGMGVL